MQELRKECAGLDAEGEPRARKEVAWSLQRYLLFAVLSCVPGPPLSELLLSVSRARDHSLCRLAYFAELWIEAASDFVTIVVIEGLEQCLGSTSCSQTGP